MRTLPAFLLLVCSGAVLGQATQSNSPSKSQTNPDDAVARPVTTYDNAAAPLNSSLPTIFIVGDSTAQNKADLGWGDHFAHYFDTSRVNVANRARAGRSSRTFIHEGAWDAVLSQLKKGDFVLIQMGHNDGGQLDGEKPRGTLKGIGEDQKEVTLLDGSKEVVHTYGWYLRKYIADTRAKGATPILLSLTVRNIWTDGRIERDMGYDGFIGQTAEAEHVAFVDMATVEADKLEAMGAEKTKLLFPIDHTHTSAEGAELNAGAVVEALRRANSPLTTYLR